MYQKYKQKIKKYLCSILNVPYSRYGIPHLLFKHLEVGQPLVLFDVGAHKGCFTQSIAQYCRITDGILIEPLPDKCAALREIFDGPQWHIYDCVLSSEEGIIDFEVNEESETSSILKIKRDMYEHSSTDVRLKTIIKRYVKTVDSIFNELRLSYIDLLKIDVQGAEHLVLSGAINSLEKTLMIWIEVSFKPLYENSAIFLDIYDLLSPNFKFLGMSPVFYAPDGELLQCDVLFMKR
jgi:FkbM family methyltransferase